MSHILTLHITIDSEESLPSGPDAYDQSLEALLTQPAASEKRSHSRSTFAGDIRDPTLSLSIPLEKQTSPVYQAHGAPQSSVTLIYRADKPIIYPLASGRSSSRTLLLVTRYLEPEEDETNTISYGRLLQEYKLTRGFTPSTNRWWFSIGEMVVCVWKVVVMSAHVTADNRSEVDAILSGFGFGFVHPDDVRSVSDGVMEYSMPKSLKPLLWWKGKWKPKAGMDSPRTKPCLNHPRTPLDSSSGIRLSNITSKWLRPQPETPGSSSSLGTGDSVGSLAA
ncbi:hypothetical protein Tco_1032017 [Tanacetum coccineum]|uniref:Uncharacterized protein n=1 Tax=Tanacetum coccineum TaxID=301880 RepID=A0ABQ5GC12_9ASTR